MTNNSAAADNGAAPNHPLLHGVCAAMSSPFDDSGEALDERRLRSHVESLVDAGVHGLVLAAGTG